MKKVIAFMFAIALIINISFCYQIEKKENNVGPDDRSRYIEIDHSNFDSFTYVIPSDTGSTVQYVENYSVGNTTILQACSVGFFSKKSSVEADHVKEVFFDEIYGACEKSEIIEIQKPTCLEDGYMIIKCKNKIKYGGFLGIGQKEKECEKTAKINLEKTGHTVLVHSIDGRCENCGEIHSKKELIKDFSDENNHYYSCNFESCGERISEEHSFTQNQETKEWICSVCGKKDDKHKASSMWITRKENHYKKCVVEGCTELFEKGEHSGGSHSNDGLCLVCGRKYQTHQIDVSSFHFDENYHFYACSYKDCKAEIFSKHEKGSIIYWDSDAHWYECTNEECTKKFDYEKHYDGEIKDGVCEKCKKNYEGEVENLIIKNIKGNDIFLKETGDNIKIDLEYEPSNLANTYFEWEIDDEDIATVTDDGIVTAVSDGTTVLHIKWNGKEITCTIYVNMESFEIKANKEEIYEGKDYGTKLSVITKNIDEKDIEWSVEPKKLAWIDEDDLMLYGNLNVADIEGEDVIVWAKLSNGLVARTEVRIKHLGGATHENGGKCKCGKKLEDHKLSNSYEFDEKSHWKICSNSKCKNKQIDKGTHTSNIRCTKCDWEKETDDTPGGNSSSGGSSSSGGNSSSGGSSSSGGNSSSGGSLSPGGNSPSGGSSSSGGNPPSEDNKPPEEKKGWEWYITDTFHEQVKPGTTARVGKWGVHTYGKDGKCTECGRDKNQKCSHQGTGRIYVPIEGKDRHSIMCDNCKEILEEEDCTGSPCKCEQYEEKEVETDMNTFVKVYYIDENGLFTPEEYTKKESERKSTKIKFNVVSKESPPVIKWRMNTKPKEEYFSNKNTQSDDGTIVFKYCGDTTPISTKSNGNIKEYEVFFTAELAETCKVLSGEIVIDVWLMNNGGATNKQTVKIIKNGPPKSHCEVYIEQPYLVVNKDSTLNLLIKTMYDEFDDVIVRKIRNGEIAGVNPNEFPLYKVVENSYSVKVDNESILKCKLGDFIGDENNTKFNGSIIKIDANPKKEGEVKIAVELKTKYELINHEPIIKERKYIIPVYIVEKAEDIPPPVSPGGPGGAGGTGESSGGTSETEGRVNGGTATLACIGALALLLIAVVGSKMISR